MTMQQAQAVRPPRHFIRSAGAIIAGFVTVVVLSLAVDEVLHLINVFPPWGEPMYSPRLNLLALSYRILFTVVGGYVAARLAPNTPLRHAVILGLIGLLPGIGGVIAASGMELGPLWYPIAIAVTGLPCCWLGGVLHNRMQAVR